MTTAIKKKNKDEQVKMLQESIKAMFSRLTRKEIEAMHKETKKEFLKAFPKA